MIAASNSYNHGNTTNPIAAPPGGRGEHANNAPTINSGSVMLQNAGNREELSQSARLVAKQLIAEFSSLRQQSLGTGGLAGSAANDLPGQDTVGTKRQQNNVTGQMTGTGSQQPQLFTNGVEIVLAKELTKIATVVLADAKKFMLKSKRNSMKIQDLLGVLKYRRLNHYYYLVADKLYSSNPKESIDVNGAIESSNNKILDVNLLNPTIHAHWLCIDGVQPMINENPDVAKIEKEAENKLMSSLKTNHQNPVTNKADITVEGLNLLTYEQQLLFSNMTEMCFGNDEVKQTTALSLLKADPGFADILPHFISFIVEGVRLNVNEQNMVNLIYLMRMASALVLNPHLNIEHYLHDLIPAIMTCILSKTLYKKSEDGHWALRDYSAKLIGTIYNRKTNAFNNHHTQIFRVIDEIIESDNFIKYSWNAKYGVIRILCELNSHVIANHLLDKIKPLFSRMQDEIDDPDCDILTKKAIKRITDTLEAVIGVPKFWDDIQIDVDLQNFTEKFGPFGERLFLCITGQK